MIKVELEPELLAWLREQAERHGLSVGEQAVAVLRAARDAAAEAERRRAEQARWDALFALSIKLPPGSPNSTDIIRQMRDER